MNRKTLAFLVLAIPATLFFVPAFSIGNDSRIGTATPVLANVEFASTQPGLPDPATVGLLIIGGAGFLIFRLRSAACRKSWTRRRNALQRFMTAQARND